MITEENLNDLGYGDPFFRYNLKGTIMKEINGKLHFTEVKNFCSAKDKCQKNEKASQILRKTPAEDTSDKESLPKYSKNLDLNSKTTNNLLKNGPETSRHFTKETYRQQISI